MDTINKFLKDALKSDNVGHGIVIQDMRPQLVCKDGFKISVQASKYHYCSPRVDGDVIYEAVELGYPNMEDELIADFAEDPGDLTRTVYGYVPVEVVNRLIEKHGGILESKEEET